jgi:hypothetical protein
LGMQFSTRVWVYEPPTRILARSRPSSVPLWLRRGVVVGDALMCPI